MSGLRKAVLSCLCIASLLATPKVSFAATKSLWDAAVAARATFEAEPSGTHTKADYARIMDAFRAIYHANPSDPHAARSVQQVAELLAEEARELNDPKALSDARGQYDFLAKSYPAYTKSADRAAKALTTEPAPAVAKAPAPPNTPKPEPAPEKPALSEEKSITTQASVTGIRHWSTTSYTRVAIDLSTTSGDAVSYQAARVEHPDRIFFDLHHARLAPQLAGKSFAVTDDGFLTKIRAAQYSDDVTRVVLDVHEVADYSAFLLPNPLRLIIDIHGNNQPSAANTADPEPAPPTTKKSEPAPVTRIPDKIVSPQPTHTPGVEVSSLPPTPVTDGSASFGLPSTVAERGTAVSAPRVVVSSRPTVAKPVPNSVTTNSAESKTEVAAVSNQPGKVEATTKPTSAPIVSKNIQSDHYVKPSRAAAATTTVPTDPDPIKLGKKSKPQPGTPAEAAPPTAAGDVSLMRALGLKIGRIVIDAGHGGHDSGTLGVGGIQEKDVVLDVALRLGKLLHERLGAEIVYTRADDTFIPLETRTAIANKAQADLFISVHANSSQDASARGVEVYYLNFTSDADAMKVASRENAVSTQSVHELSDLVKKIALKDKIEESRELATDVDTSLYGGLTKGNSGLRDRGVKKAPFVVLIGANMPSILAEISFVTNPSDAEQLQRPDYRQRVAESLYGGVARYASAINGSPRKTSTLKAGR